MNRLTDAELGSLVTRHPNKKTGSKAAKYIAELEEENGELRNQLALATAGSGPLVEVKPEKEEQEHT